MSHPTSLIEAVLIQIQRDYSPSDHTFAIERAVPGTRMFPDILVRSPSGEMVCAVEIGYTRPEKLTAYRELGIPDVRWYDKQGQLHTEWETKLLRAEVEIASPAPDEVAVYELRGLVECPCEPEDATVYVWAMIVTDYVRFWMPVYCDKCGDVWMHGPDFVDFEDFRIDLGSLGPAAFGRSYGRRQLMTWPDATALVESRIGIELPLLDFHCVHEERSVVELVRRELSGAARVEFRELAAPSVRPA